VLNAVVDKVNYEKLKEFPFIVFTGGSFWPRFTNGKGAPSVDGAGGIGQVLIEKEGYSHLRDLYCHKFAPSMIQHLSAFRPHLQNPNVTVHIFVTLLDTDDEPIPPTEVNLRWRCKLIDAITKECTTKPYLVLNKDVVRMIKDPEAGYECKRSVAWLKLKPFIEVSLEVKDVEEGTGKNIGRLGALVCEGVDDGKSISVNVGSGFTDDNRIEFWGSRTLLPGNIVEVRADAVTQNQDGTYSLRFPRFKGFRGFEVGEKL
jgi:hypothetical protein